MSNIYNWNEINKYLATEFMGWTLCSDDHSRSWYGDGEVPVEDCIMGTGAWNPESDFKDSKKLIKKCKDEDYGWDEFNLTYDFEEERWKAVFIRSSMYHGGNAETAFHEEPEKAICLVVLMTEDVDLEEFKID